MKLTTLCLWCLIPYLCASCGATPDGRSTFAGFDTRGGIAFGRDIADSYLRNRAPVSSAKEPVSPLPAESKPASSGFLNFLGF